ncbi:hypothetical protein H5410_061550 [Solanum commersonii]|uniref:Uncharacterized protein n=1 Tax=Solanum commersonii TaxID=4109 RepID=A0A9J5W9I8_SOLCO|nr:hypothetical protein H5410_061550 [Solanum commersonii]
MVVATWVDKLVNLGCHDHFQNYLSKLYYWNFLAQLEQFAETAYEFDFEGLLATLATMLPKWKVLKLRNNYKLKIQVMLPIGYTFYGVIEMVELVVRHTLRLGLVAMLRLGGEQASKVVHHYLKEGNFSLDGSDHVRQYCLYHISSASGASSDPSSTIDDILVINV